MLTLSLSIVIGLLLGLLGGGGSILTVPMLVYLLHIEPKAAIFTTFVVVGVSSLMALIPHLRHTAVCWKSGLVFGGTGMLGAFCGGQLASYISDSWLMTLFGLISLSTGSLMLLKKSTTRLAFKKIIGYCPLKLPLLRLSSIGFLVGCLTGLVGVGGGFLIVPALSLLVGLPMQAAIGTSILVIAMNALAGFIAYNNQLTLDFTLTLVVTTGALLGSGIGAWLSHYLPAGLLKRGFGLLVILVAGYVLSQNLDQALVIAMQDWLTNQHSLVISCAIVLTILARKRLNRRSTKLDQP